MEDNSRINLTKQADGEVYPSQAAPQSQSVQYQQPVYQQPQQPVYQQPSQPVYQQPSQPVYQQPSQPVYQQPQQPMYQVPTKFCKHCGQSIPAEAVICTHCGCQVEEMKSNAAAANQPIIINNNNNNNNNVGGAPQVVVMGRQKNKWVAVLLCFFLGGIGAHRFYEGKIGSGLLYLFTAGLFGIGVLIDFIILLCKPNPYYV